MRHTISNSKKKVLNKWHLHEWDVSTMYNTTTKHTISPKVLILNLCPKWDFLFFTSPTIVSLGAKQNSCFPRTGLPVEVKRTVPRFWGARIKIWGLENKGPRKNCYVGSTINHHPNTLTLTMASAANDSDLPSLSSPVPPCRNNSQRYRDGLWKLFVGQTWPLAAAATGKHRHDASSKRRAFT